jgi:hypothetical protein
MLVVEISVSAADLAATLATMRNWLDHNKCNPVKFESQPEQGGVILVRVHFDAADLANAFRQSFAPAV